MDRLEIVDISTLPRGKPLETPLCKKRIRTWSPKVQSVARSTKTQDPPVNDDVAPDTDFHVPPVARSPRQKPPQSIAPHFSQLEIVDISTLPRGQPLETPLCKKRIRTWGPKVQSVAGSTKTPDPPVNDDVAPDTVFHVPPVARFPRQKTTQSIAPNSCQLEIVDISTLLRSKPIETPLSKNRKRASRSPCVGRPTKTMVPSVVGDATPPTNSCLTPAAGFSRRRPKRPNPKIEIVDISTLPRGKSLEAPLNNNRKRAWNPKLLSVARSTETMDPWMMALALTHLFPPHSVLLFPQNFTVDSSQYLPESAQCCEVNRDNGPVDDGAAPATDSSLPPALSSSPPKKTPPSKARNTSQKVKSRTTKTMVPSVVGDATPPTNSCLTPAAGFSRRRRKRPDPKKVKSRTTKSMVPSVVTPAAGFSRRRRKRPDPK